jgi:hypothetical protein
VNHSDQNVCNLNKQTCRNRNTFIKRK